jgi:hypothetical protein
MGFLFIDGRALKYLQGAVNVEHDKLFRQGLLLFGYVTLREGSSRPKDLLNLAEMLRYAQHDIS